MLRALPGSDPLAGLNPAQRDAVEHLHGPVLVVAGAGTGKTRVLTERIRYLLETLPDLAGENVLAVTYTEKAAAEMQERVRRACGQRGAGVRVQTFHAFCYDILRAHDEELRALDDTDTWIFLRRRMSELGLEVFKKIAEPGAFLNDFIKFFSRCQDELVSPADYARYVADRRAALEQQRPLLAQEEHDRREAEVVAEEEVARVYATADRLLREARRATYGAQLERAVELLRARPDLLAHYQERFRYILVDEFQDVNVALIHLLAQLAGAHRNLMAVGDDDQAIYRFRGASYASFRVFAELFPDHRAIALEQNYRSTRNILLVAGELIRQNGPARFRADKRLVASRPPGEKVEVIGVEDAAQEAAWVTEEIRRRRASEGLAYGDFAVLYRSHRHRNLLVEALTRAAIPFVIRGLSILENTLVRDLVAYLRAVHLPGDNIAFARLLAMPAWQLTPERLADLAQRARRADPRISLHQAAESLHEDVLGTHTRIGALLDLLAHLRQRAASWRVTEIFDELLARLELQLLPSDPDAPYLNCLGEFLRTWETEKSGTRRLGELVEYLDYFDEANGKIALPEETAPRDAVQLMTVHAAKGLEFDNVFLLRLNQGDFPTRKRRPLFEFPEKLMKEPLPAGDFHIQEERRLCYVAMTRARARLSLLTTGGDRKKPSVFLEDIQRQPHLTGRSLAMLEPAPLPAPRAELPLPLDSAQRPLFGRQRHARCYSRIGAWALEGLAAPLPEPLALSHSSVETYRRCPLQFRFAYVWRLPGRLNPALVFGGIMHRTVAEYFKARARLPALPWSELEHLYEQQWRATPWDFRDAYQRLEYERSGREQLRAFWERHLEARPDVLHLEKEFRWRWEDVELNGRIDQIDRLGGREVEIIEYKTGQPHRKERVEKSLQLAIYAAAAQESLGLEPARLTLYSLTTNEPVSIAPTDKQRAEAYDTLRDTAARLRAGEFPARPNFHCRYCDYRPLCPAHEQPAPGAAAVLEPDEGGGEDEAEKAAGSPS